jgi:taurine---2-oxoglutarate transaminase
MNAQEMIDLCKRHTLWSWSKGKDNNPLPIARAEGVYVYTADGQKMIDFSSQLMSVLIGHSHPKVIAAMKKSLDGLIYAYPGAATEARARTAKLLAEMCPGDINSFFFTLGGAEANENAIRSARAFTGRHKILSRYRSYHGGTNLTLQATGDPRRWASEPGAPGFVRVLDPQPYNFSFGSSEAEVTANNLRYLEEIIDYEGPQTIAAMIIEPVTGTNGVLAPPKGYLEGLHALLKRHGILLICDEVMAGFGRTGKMFSYEHGGVSPDIVTMAKGLTSSYMPLGAMGVTQRLHDYFQENMFWGGLTYNAHPLALDCAYAVLTVMREERLVENAARMENVMRGEMEKLRAKHRSFGDGRCIGLFGMIDVKKNAKGDPIAPYNTSHPAMNKVAKFFRDNGLFTYSRWSSFMCSPPLCINERELREGFAIIDKALDITDEVFEG